jgi:hypothetical protein
MITSTGRDIISKFLIGQTTSFASHIAIGSGAVPSTTLGNYGAKTELDFEMTRVPIISKSISTEVVRLTATSVQKTVDGTFVFTIPNGNKFNAGTSISVSGAGNFTNASVPTSTTSNGNYTILSSTSTTITVTDPTGDTDPQTLTGQTITISGYAPQIVFSAELPVLDRYGITEFGIYPSGTNSYSNGTDSYILANFTQNESWQLADYNSGTTETTFSSVPYYSTITDATNNITLTDIAFITNAENAFFNATRIARQEQPRFLSDALIVAGNMSDFSANLTPATTSDYITVPFSADLSQNSSLDELRIALSLVNKLATTATVPKSLNVMLKFISSDGSSSASYHFRTSDATSLISGTGKFTSSRYGILTLQLGQATYTSKTVSFDWKDVRALKIYASVETGTDYSGVPTSDFSICLDAIRFENKSNTNPLYGLSGYTIVNTSGTPIAKNSGTNNIVEFKFVLGVNPNV